MKPSCDHAGQRFTPVGRIGLGEVALPVAETTDTQTRIAIPWRDSRGLVGHLSGSGADLRTAIAVALQPLARTPFVIETAAVTAAERRGRDRHAQVLIRVETTEGARHALGQAVASDDATAITIAAARALAVGGALDRRHMPPGGRDVDASTERIVAGIGRLFPAATLDAKTLGAVREIVANELHHFGEGQAILAAHSPDRSGMLTRFDAQAALLPDRGSATTRRAPSWWEWFPGLDNADRTLREVLMEMPAAPPTAIPWIVRLFENDRGWLRLHGAVSLERHDMIHVLLGRGLLDQDEAFVIGFTMGSTKAVSRLERWFFKCAISRLYPEPYRIPRQLLAAYDLGLEAGKDCVTKDLHLRLRDDMLDRPLGETRGELGIDPAWLRKIYAREREAVPGTLASLRLPVA